MIAKVLHYLMCLQVFHRCYFEAVRDAEKNGHHLGKYSRNGVPWFTMVLALDRNAWELEQVMVRAAKE